MNVHIRELSEQEGQRVGRYVGMFRANYEMILNLCDTLETVADGLPSQPDLQTCMTLSRSLMPALRKAQLLEEEELFPLLLHLTENHPALMSSIERLRAEHSEDECFAEEITGLLAECANHGKSANPEGAGYMLRGFFSGMRRHIAFERECLMAVAMTRSPAIQQL